MLSLKTFLTLHVPTMDNQMVVVGVATLVLKVKEKFLVHGFRAYKYQHRKT